MDESAPIRAITIGVSTLIAIATISAVIMYYKTARQMALSVGTGQDFAANYEESIKGILLKGESNVSGNNYITGTDVINLINYFYDDETVDIDISNIRFVDDYDATTYDPKIDTSVANTYTAINRRNNKTEILEVVDKILPQQKFSISIIDSTNPIKLTIKGE